MKKLLSLLLGVALVFGLTACGQTSTTGSSAAVGGEDSITIVYTNDIHSYIANTKTSSDTASSGTSSSETTETPALRLSKISQMVKDLRSEGNDVLLVDAGDEVQGNSYGSIDKGVSVIDIMNAAGYQLATPGNHDFDYGMDQFYALMKEASFPYITCNFHATDTSKQTWESYEIFEVDGKKIAFIGITTPETITSSTPSIFQNEQGEYCYTIDGTANAADLYTAVQNTINQVEQKADYVIALGHLGVGADEQRNGISSEDVIANTSGLDAFIDGHSHTVMESNQVTDKDGNPVLLTQTGAYLESVGVMEIETNGKITATTKLVDDYNKTDATVAALEQKLIDAVNAEYGKQVATLDNTLYIKNPENAQERLIRSQEMNLGDFAADSIYWFYNVSKQMNCDIAFANGGGIRTNLNAGKVTLNDVVAVEPFGDVVCLIQATGQQIQDALEMGATVAGTGTAGNPAENGGFFQVAGLQYTIDASIPSSVVTDANGMFVSVNGAYRVKDIQVYNKETGAYEALDLNKTYSVGGINYILRENGNGMSMFQNSTLIVDYSGIDCDVFASYCKSFPQNNGYAQINTNGSPLKCYANYLLNYENPYGAGRITILNSNAGGTNP